LKVGGLYRTAARLQGAAAIAVPPADPALQLTAERRDGGTAIVAVLRAAATGPFSADARLFVADSAEQVRQSGRFSWRVWHASGRMCQRSAAAQVAVRVSANVMPASKGTPALRPDVFVVAEEGGAADTDLDA